MALGVPTAGAGEERLEKPRALQRHCGPLARRVKANVRLLAVGEGPEAVGELRVMAERELMMAEAAAVRRELLTLGVLEEAERQYWTVCEKQEEELGAFFQPAGEVLVSRQADR